jgi:hypothetical protein
MGGQIVGNGRNWAEQAVRDELPTVRVWDRAREYETVGEVRGKMLKTARVVVEGQVYEFAWSTIARALSVGRPLVV